jgi:hypothetical protein
LMIIGKRSREQMRQNPKEKKKEIRRKKDK